VVAGTFSGFETGDFHAVWVADCHAKGGCNGTIGLPFVTLKFSDLSVYG
jgi:hypothetical protein